MLIPQLKKNCFRSPWPGARRGSSISMIFPGLAPGLFRKSVLLEVARRVRRFFSPESPQGVRGRGV
eukprot:6306422-Pyramimonas_sp.AAC.1